MASKQLLKVLVVDDQRTSRMLIRDALDQIGITQVSFAEDGEQALKMMMSSPANFIISDFNMPKLDGLQLLKAIRSYAPTKKTPFVILTGRGDKELVQKAAALGVNNFLVKPVSVPVLQKTLEAVLGAFAVMSEPVARRRLNIIQGEAKWGSGEDLVLTTLLGSCVAACIRDPVAGIGGMNHFLLPGSADQSHSSRSESYGLYLMELLINGLMKKGARKDRLEVKLFGGARTLDGLTDIGSKNAKFAKDFLAMEGIPYRGGDLGGEKGRRIEYWPHTGRARQIFIEKSAGLPPPPPIRVRQESIGDLELF